MRVTCSVLSSLVAITLLGGCVGGGQTIDRLDTSTGLTWRSAAAPAVYARTDLRYSRAARDYLYVGPVETNARGLRQHFLWVGVATTLDRGFLAPEQPLPASITLFVDGEPIVLGLETWAALVGSTELAPYDPPIATAVELGVRVTANLLGRIDLGGIDRVGVRYPDERFETFTQWQFAPAWTGFFTGDGAR